MLFFSQRERVTRQADALKREEDVVNELKKIVISEMDKYRSGELGVNGPLELLGISLISVG